MLAGIAGVRQPEGWPGASALLGLILAGIAIAVTRRSAVIAALATGSTAAGYVAAMALGPGAPTGAAIVVLALGLHQAHHLASALTSGEPADVGADLASAARAVLPGAVTTVLAIGALGLFVTGGAGATGEGGRLFLGTVAAGISVMTMSHFVTLPAFARVALPTPWVPPAPPSATAPLDQVVSRWAPPIGWGAVMLVAALVGPALTVLHPSFAPHTTWAAATTLVVVSLGTTGRARFSAPGGRCVPLVAAAATVSLALGVVGTVVAASAENGGAPSLPLLGALLTLPLFTLPALTLSLLTLGLGLSLVGATARRGALGPTPSVERGALLGLTLLAAATSVTSQGSAGVALGIGLGMVVLVHGFVTLFMTPALTLLWARARDTETKQGGRWTRLAVTVGLAGDAPVAPGTLGALVAVPLGFVLIELGLWPSVAIVAALTALSLPITTRYLERTGTHDPSEVVLDEFVGCLIAMVMAPFGVVWGWAAFALFRLFDITKPGPVGYMDRRVKGAGGVIGDDVVAGLMAGGVLLGVRALTTAGGG
ncbi:MAG: phosphatidylglycerophosphatase A [Myxococcota bacterium]